MMCATVTWPCVGSPPCSWESLLGEGSVSLNDWIPLLNHWSGHKSCVSGCGSSIFILMSFMGCVFFVICWSVNLIYASPALKIGRMVVNMTYCDLWIDKQKNFCVWMICNEVDVAYHGEVNGNGLYGWSVIVMSCSCDGCIYLSVMV